MFSSWYEFGFGNGRSDKSRPVFRRDRRACEPTGRESVYVTCAILNVDDCPRTTAMRQSSEKGAALEHPRSINGEKKGERTASAAMMVKGKRIPNSDVFGVV